MTSESGHASMIPVLEALLPIKDAIEFGMGNHSTPWFLGHCASLVSVETEPEWVAKVGRLKEIDGRGAWVTIRTDNELTARNMIRGLRFDLALVDGKAMYRAPLVEYLLHSGQAPIILAHDSERPDKEYGYGKIETPEGWCKWQAEPKLSSPWTLGWSRTWEPADAVSKVMHVRRWDN